MRIERVDPFDERDFDRWYDVLRAVQQGTWPGDEPWDRGDQLVGVRLASDPATAVTERVELLVAVDGDDVVGAGRLLMPVLDNTDRADLLVRVLPARRRAGAGSALVEALVARARSCGRSVLWAEVDQPEGAPSMAPFLERHGFSLALVESRRDLALPGDEERWAALRDDASARSRGYEVRTWADRCPDDLLDGRVVLGRAMSTAFPAGDLHVEEEAWDAGRVRRLEESFAERGRRYVGAMALRDGEAAGFCEIGVQTASPDRAFQWETLVLPEHRGRRLGMALKLAALGELRRVSPATRRVTTINADVNAPMISVNEALGFRRVGALVTWQRLL